MRHCFTCHSSENVHVHHIDWNHKNNTPDNKILLCQRCHVAAHNAGYLSRSELMNVRLIAMERAPEMFDDQNGSQREQDLVSYQLELFGS